MTYAAVRMATSSIYGATHHWFRHAQLLRQGLPSERWGAISAIEEVADEGANSTRIGSRPEWKEEEGEVEACRTVVS